MPDELTHAMTKRRMNIGALIGNLRPHPHPPCRQTQAQAHHDYGKQGHFFQSWQSGSIPSVVAYF